MVTTITHLIRFKNILTCLSGAHRLIPSRLLLLYGAYDLVTGADPNFIGLHSFTDPYEYDPSLKGKYTYNQIAHCVWGNDKIFPTIVVPERERWFDPYVALHEIGHVIDSNLRAKHGFTYDFPKVSAYAKTNQEEGFAEAFCAWLMPHLCPWVSWDTRMQIQKCFMGLVN